MLAVFNSLLFSPGRSKPKAANKRISLVGSVNRPIGDQLRMLAAECFGDVAAPADRPVRGHGLLQILERNFIPLDGLVVLVDERGRMIMPVDFAKRFVAVHARSPRVPLVDDGGNQAGLGRFFDLRQTFLAAALHFRPARAFAQMEMRGPMSCFHGGFPRCNPYGGRLVILRATDDSLPPELKVGAQSAREFECHGNGNGNCQNEKDVFHGSFPFALKGSQTISTSFRAQGAVTGITGLCDEYPFMETAKPCHAANSSRGGAERARRNFAHALGTQLEPELSLYGGSLRVGILRSHV